MARSKGIKVFEALIGTEWKSWKAESNSRIAKSGNKIIITTTVETDNFSGVLTTEFDLTKLIAYSVGV